MKKHSLPTPKRLPKSAAASPAQSSNSIDRHLLNDQLNEGEFAFNADKIKDAYVDVYEPDGVPSEAVDLDHVSKADREKAEYLLSQTAKKVKCRVKRDDYEHEHPKSIAVDPPSEENLLQRCKHSWAWQGGMLTRPLVLFQQGKSFHDSALNKLAESRAYLIAEGILSTSWMSNDWSIEDACRELARRFDSEVYRLIHEGKPLQMEPGEVKNAPFDFVFTFWRSSDTTIEFILVVVFSTDVVTEAGVYECHFWIPPTKQK